MATIIDRETPEIKQVLDKIDPLHYKPHVMEQFAFRIYCCQNCFIEKKCKFCKCNPLDKIKEPISCNKKVYPNTLNSFDWDEYKKQHNIIIK